MNETNSWFESLYVFAHPITTIHSASWIHGVKKGTQWVHVSTAVNKTRRMLVDGAFIACVQPFGSEDPIHANSQFAWTADSSGELSSLCCCWSDWMLRISSSVRNNLVRFDWFRTEAEHATRSLIDSYLHTSFLPSFFTYFLSYLLTYLLTYLPSACYTIRNCKRHKI